LYHEKAPIVAERIFQRLLSSKTLQPDTICFISLLHAWSNSSSSTTIHQDSAESSFASAVRAQAILEQMIQNHLDLVHTVCFNICIDGWANQGRLDKAEDILNRMETLYQQQHCVDKDRLRPSISSFNSAIKACALANHKNCHDSVNAARQAELILHRMESSGITPNIESFTWVMQAYIKTTEPGEKVQALLDQLEDRFAKGDIIHPPSSVCYLTAIQAWGRTTMTPSISLVKDRHIDKITPPERAEMLVQRMIEISSDDTGRRDLEPCVIIYTALIDAWGNSLRPEASGNALRIFTNMKQGKLGRKAFPNTVTLNVLLKTFCRHGRIEDAWDLLKQTKQHVAPDLKSYHTILKAYTHSDLTSAAENAQELVREMETEYDDRKNEDLKPTEYTYMQLLVSWGNSKRHDAAVHAEEIFWNMMNQDGTSVKPTKHHLNCVLRAFSRSAEGGAAERAESFLERVQKLMGKSSELIEPDAISHLHMIQVWIRSGRMIGRRKAKSHLDRVRALCTENESDVLDAAITAFSRHFA
jgi:pentatricopeptide repeat protein